MKQLIVFLAVILFLMFFPLQIALSQINHHQLLTAQEIAHNYAQRARQHGYYRPEDISDLREELAERLNLDANQLIIRVTTTPKYRFDRFVPGELIDYEIIVPVNRLLVMNRFIGIPDEDNSMQQIIKGQVHSEVLLP